MNHRIYLALALGLWCPLAAAAPRLALVPGASSYDTQGFVRIAGEIRNEGDEPVCAPGVAVVLNDATGQTLGVKSLVTLTQQELGRRASDGVLAARSWVLPGETVPFTYRRDRSKISGTPAAHRLEALGRACSTAPPQLLVEQVQFGQDRVAGFLRVSGLVHNTGKTACRSANLAIGLYDATGKLLVAETTSGVDRELTDLPAGSGSEFSRRSLPVPAGQQVAVVKVWGNCRL